MDSNSLKTASTYINNLLLARGLLRDSEPIPFEHARTHKGKDGDATMAKTMSLVHDLILQRDREQSHHQSLTTHLQTLRADATSTTARLSRLQTAHDAQARQLAASETAARTARTALRSAEAANKALEKEVVRLKQKVGEVRRAAEKDVRRRDEVVRGLRAHLSARQRGSKVGVVGASVVITPGSRGRKGETKGDEARGGADTADPGYSLRQETTEFLTQLGQSLSDENDGLIALLRGVVGEVKGLLGVSEEGTGKGRGGVKKTGGDIQIQTIVEEEDTAMVNALPTSYEALAADVDAVLGQLKEVLTSPNFVPLEEVETRDEEIGILRHGWERMEARWREAVAMMEGWRKRIEEKGDTVQLEDLKMGLGLGQGFEDLASIAGSARKRSDSCRKNESDESGIDLVKEYRPVDKKVEYGEGTEQSDMFDLESPTQHQPLRETKANPKSPRRVSFMLSLDGTADENSELDILANAPDLSPGKVFSQGQKAHGQQSRGSSPKVSFAKTDTGTPSHQGKNNRLPPSPTTRLTMSRRLSAHLRHTLRNQQPDADEDSVHDHFTVQDKLRAAQVEAEAAAEARAKKMQEQEDERRRQMGKEVRETRSNMAGSPAKAVKRTRIGGRPKRRKSTLTPDELMGLLGD
ncbi:hypothetical protein EV356DRAFT_486205 [Viridothelium virens]|uniref:NIMA interactive protein n=1 Tax=Viridothelium virens TaxID=1048519 RepID=A0A6A6H6Z1_VIRVR|nr:hypothetical protein EV356DRAFT_486205 [Viridothelium virens]